MISKETAKKLIEKNGTPIYVFEEERFVQNYLNLQSAFRKVYPKYQIAYSYKTNYTPYICNTIKQLGGFAEVVSDMEYELAKLLGYDNHKIIYNGPWKGDKLDEHILAGGMTNIDSFDEARRVVNLGKQNPEQIISVGLRINTDIGAGYISRFGIEENSEDLHNVIQVLNNQKNIRIVGLHCHISRARDIGSWKRRIENLLSIADNYIDSIPQYINVGSGMYGEMDESLSIQFPSPIPSYEDYAMIVGGAMCNHYGNGNGCPTLLSEPGTTVIANYMTLLTQVKTIKNIRDKSFVTVDSSYHNIGEICFMKKLPYMVIPRNNISDTDKHKPSISRMIMGYTCLEQDCLHIDFCDDLKNGDYIAFGNVGGYSIVAKPPFIKPNCAVVAIKANQLIEIKRKETFHDLFTTFLI